MGLKSFFSKLVHNTLFDDKWTCNACGCENFNGEYFCDNCLKSLPFNDKCICDHCGRSTPVPEVYCLTCRETLLSIDKSRSAFVYEGKIKSLVKRMKRVENAYLCEVFAGYLSSLYFSNLFTADAVVFVPMTINRERKRGYNQSRRLAECFAEKTSLAVLDVIAKSKETKKQALLSAKDRRVNLRKSFKMTDKKAIKDKSLVIIDDVTTTGSTAETIAELLKGGGAKSVIMLTVASVRSKKGI